MNYDCPHCESTEVQSLKATYENGVAGNGTMNSVLNSTLAQKTGKPVFQEPTGLKIVYRAIGVIFIVLLFWKAFKSILAFKLLTGSGALLIGMASILGGIPQSDISRFSGEVNHLMVTLIVRIVVYSAIFVAVMIFLRKTIEKKVNVNLIKYDEELTIWENSYKCNRCGNTFVLEKNQTMKSDDNLNRGEMQSENKSIHN